jgi:hypothetical protein
MDHAVQSRFRCYTLYARPKILAEISGGTKISAIPAKINFSKKNQKKLFFIFSPFQIDFF